MRVVVYARVSSSIQRDKQTIASQLHEVPRAVERMGWRVVDTVIDDGRSAATGKLAKREGFRALLERMGRTPRDFDCVAVIDQDRITRTESMRERGEILGTFQDSGTQLFIASTGQLRDMRDLTHQLLANFDGFTSASDNVKRSEKTVRGKLEAIRKGRKPAGPTPVGYVYSRDEGWSIDPLMGPVVKEVFQRIAKGESCGQIATDFHARKVPTARPSKSGKRAAGRWTRERVHYIATSDTYLGSWLADEARDLRIAVPRLITDQLYAAAHKVLDRHGKRGQRRTFHTYLVHGVGRCGVCGARLSPLQTNSGTKAVTYYTCVRRRVVRPGEKRCTLPMRRQDDVDARVWEAVRGVLEQPRIVEQAMARQRRDAKAAGALTGSLEEAEAKLRTFDQRAQRMADQYLAGAIPDELWERHLAKVKAERPRLLEAVERAKAGVTAAAAHHARVAGVLETVERLRAKLARATPQTKRELVQALCPGTDDHHVVLRPDGSLQVRVVIADPTCATSEVGTCFGRGTSHEVRLDLTA